MAWTVDFDLRSERLDRNGASRDLEGVQLLTGPLSTFSVCPVMKAVSSLVQVRPRADEVLRPSRPADPLHACGEGELGPPRRKCRPVARASTCRSTASAPVRRSTVTP